MNDRDLWVQKKEGLDPALFHYNMAAYLYKESYDVPALYHLLKAQSYQLDPHLIGQAKSLILGRLSLPESPDVGPTLPLSNSDAISLYYALLFCLFSFSLWIRKLRFCRRLSFFSFMAILPVVYYFCFVHGYEKAIVMQAAIVREGPSNLFEKKDLLPPGTKIILDKEFEGRFHISSPAHAVGWVWRDDIAIY